VALLSSCDDCVDALDLGLGAAVLLSLADLGHEEELAPLGDGRD